MLAMQCQAEKQTFLCYVGMLQTGFTTRFHDTDNTATVKPSQLPEQVPHVAHIV